MTKILRIVNWNEHFENNRTRALTQMRWVPFQNSFDGDGFIQLLEDHIEGLAHFGCWVLIVEVASTCALRGTLVTSMGKPHTAETLARKTRSSADIFEEAIKRLLRIGWLEEIEKIDIRQASAGITQASAGSRQASAGITQATDYGRKEGIEGIEGRNKPRTKFIPPSVEEITEYCKFRKNKVDPTKFWAHYDANGWVQGKNKPLKKWKSAVITWEKNNFDTQLSGQNQTRPPLKDFS